MDWLQRLEQKKKIRKTAGRILAKDMKQLIFSWMVLVLLFVICFDLLFPYLKTIESLNIGVSFYLLMLLLMKLYAMPEQIFYFLPMTQKEIRQYLNARNNLLEAFMTLASVVLAAVLVLCGVNVFWERGLCALLMLLSTVEGISAAMFYDYREEAMRKEELHGRARVRRTRSILYFLYGIVLLIYEVIGITFAAAAEHQKIVLLFCLAGYISMVFIRKDVMRWTDFTEYRKVIRKNMFARTESATQNGEDAE
ncbi:MAG: hypothetical protein ACI4FZ_13110 [Lachnospiraceae bacterium]